MGKPVAIEPVVISPTEFDSLKEKVSKLEVDIGQMESDIMYLKKGVKPRPSLGFVRSRFK